MSGPPKRRRGDLAPTREERLVLAVCLGIGAWILGGLLLQLVVPLDRAVWLAMLLATTLAALATAVARRGPAAPPKRLIGGMRRPTPRAAAASLAALAAVAISAVAIAAGSAAAGRQLDRSRFSGLWVVPADSGRVLSLGVRNHEGRVVAYRLQVSRGGRSLRTWRLRLADGESWHSTLRATPGEKPVVASLFRGSACYRRVAVEVGGGIAPRG